MLNEFPYTNQFYTLKDIKAMYAKLKKYKYHDRLLYDEYYKVNKLRFNKYKYLYIGRPLLMISKETDYADYNQIVDYFQNEERMKCKLFGQRYSPIEAFKYDKKKIYDKATEIAKKINGGVITKRIVKDTIWELGYECTSFRQIHLITFIQMFGPKKVLDPCAGWGERLLSGIVTDIEYTGVDPNTKLFKGYNEIIDTFAKKTSKSKYTLINKPFEEADLQNKTYDMIFTSPPYFDIETYSKNSTQSLAKYSTEMAWIAGFFKPMLLKAYKHLLTGGYMCININQKDKREHYVYDMLDYMYTFKDMYYYGVIGYANENRINPQPIWIWRKYDTIPNELYNPDIIIIPTRYHKTEQTNRIDITFNVVRDDFLIGGTKQRGMVPLLELTDKREYIYAGPVYGYAQIALAYAAYLTHKKGTVFVEKRDKLFSLTEYARQIGANIHGTKYRATLDDVKQESKRYYEQDTKTRFLINFGGDDKIFINNMVENIKKAWGKNKQPKRMWMVTGSAVLVNILYKVFPKTFFNVVRVGKKIWDDQLDLKRTKLYESVEKFYDVAKEQPPYPTVSTYDAKLWTFVKENGEDGDYIWNVGKDIKFDN
jgi:hypothetical protein